MEILIALDNTYWIPWFTPVRLFIDYGEFKRSYRTYSSKLINRGQINLELAVNIKSRRDSKDSCVVLMNEAKISVVNHIRIGGCPSW